MLKYLMLSKYFAGARFGRLTLIRITNGREKAKIWQCQCDCGKTSNVYQSNLGMSRTKSCGCLSKEVLSKIHFKHGHNTSGYRSRAYSTWASMLSRCTNTREPSYPRYGGRGITVCDEWANNFEAFLEDMGNPPTGMTLERENNDLGYSRENCRWATRTEQGRNKRNNILLTWNGKTQCLSAWAEELRVDYCCLKYRVYSGWPSEKVLSTPSRRKADVPVEDA